MVKICLQSNLLQSAGLYCDEYKDKLASENNWQSWQKLPADSLTSVGGHFANLVSRARKILLELSCLRVVDVTWPVTVFWIFMLHPDISKLGYFYENIVLCMHLNFSLLTMKSTWWFIPIF